MAPGHTTSTAEALHAAFAPEAPLTLGVEEELMLLDQETLDLAPCAPQLLEDLDGDGRFAAELPAAQLEIVGAPRATVAEAIAELAGARRVLHDAAAARGVRPAGGGLHPFAAAEGEVTDAVRYHQMLDEFGSIARRQLVFGLHVHVCVRGADRVVAVANALRSHLPELAALAANAPFHDGGDTGLASARPMVSGLLPRQGVPPSFVSLDAYAAALDWGRRAQRVPTPAQWWWEMRLHPRHGTLEVRVPDAQATLTDAAAVTALVHCLVADLVARHDAGEALPVAPDWRIAENRWLACRFGLDAPLADLRTGELQRAGDRVLAHAERLAGTARELGCEAELASVAALVAGGGGAGRLRAAAGGDPRRAAARLAELFLADPQPGHPD